MDDRLRAASGVPGPWPGRGRRIAAVSLLAAPTLVCFGPAPAWAVAPGPMDAAAGSFGALAIAVLLILLLTIFAAPRLYSWLRRTFPLFQERDDVPFLVFPLAGEGAGTEATAVGAGATADDPDTDENWISAEVGDGTDASANGRERGDELPPPLPARRPAAREVRGSLTPYGRAPAPQPVHAPVRDGAAGEAGVAQAADVVEAPSLPRSDETLQLLPGRLEVVSGMPPGQPKEIRFVRGGPITEITVGRGEGPPFGHIELSAPTVSRRHARLRYSDGRWTIANLSGTNPVRINGDEVEEADERVLAAGDRIELGDVVLVFHER